MAKVRGPLLSISARGSIAKSQVYASWRGVPYARQHVVPGNPRTAAQTLTRQVFRNLDDMWKKLGVLGQAPWTALARSRPFTNRNALISRNLPTLREASNMQAWLASPGSQGGLPPLSVTAAPTATAGEIEVTIQSSAAPTGWTLNAAIAQAFVDRVPTEVGADFAREGENTEPVTGGNTIVTLTGAQSGALHVVSGWLRWTRSDGTEAYGASLVTTATPL